MKRGHIKATIVNIRLNEPRVDDDEIARRAGCRVEYVRASLSRMGLKRETVFDLGRAAKRAGLTVKEIEEMANARHV